MKPITPDEVAGVRNIPDVVIEVFNELIARNYDGGQAVVLQDDVVDLIRKRMLTPFYDWMLNIEDVYRKVGWKVEYDKPGFNESYKSSFIFTRNKRKK